METLECSEKIIKQGHVEHAVLVLLSFPLHAIDDDLLKALSMQKRREYPLERTKTSGSFRSAERISDQTTYAQSYLSTSSQRVRQPLNVDPFSGSFPPDQPGSRFAAALPRDQFAPFEGDVQKTSSYQETFRSDGVADRYTIRKPVDQIGMSKEAMKGVSETRNMFKGGTGDRFEIRRRENQFPSLGSDPLSLMSVYGESHRGEEATNRPIVVHRSIDQLVFERTPQDLSTTNGAFYRPHPLLQTLPYSFERQLALSKQPFEGITSSSEAFTGLPGERFPVVKAKDQIGPNEGSFETTSENRSSYKGGSGDRFRTTRPRDQIELQKGSMQTRSLYGQLFSDIPINRPKPFKPNAQLQLPSGSFQGHSTNMTHFCDPGPPERHSKKKPTANLTVDKMQKCAFESTSRASFHGKSGERRAPKKTNDQIARSATPIDFHTCYEDAFLGTLGERFEATKPKHELLIPESPFAKSTTNSEFFKEWNGLEIERIRAKRPQQEIQLPEGEFPKATTNSECFTRWDAENLDRVKPKKLLEEMQKPEGKMDSKSAYSSEFQEINECERPVTFCPSDQYEWADGERDFSTISKLSYTEARGSAYNQRRPENQISMSTDAFQGLSENKEKFGEKLISRTIAVRPATDNLTVGTTVNGQPAASRNAFQKIEDRNDVTSHMFANSQGLDGHRGQDGNGTRFLNSQVSQQNKSQILLG